MILQEISNYKRSLRLYIHGMGLLSASFFSLLQLTSNDYTMSALSALSAVYFIVMIYWLKKHDRYLWHGLGFIAIGPGVLLHALYANPEYGVLWTYVCVSLLFLMLRFRDAIISSVLYLVAASYFILPYFNTPMLVRIYSSLITVWFVSLCLSYLIERLLNTLNTTATRDPLTKALNRQTFHRSIDAALADHRRNKVIGVLFIFDLDHFKKVNDQYGHNAGDKILREIADIVHQRIRETDQFFRYGGEEFAILLRHTPLQNAATLADEIRSLVEAHTFSEGIKVTISGGISEVDGSINVQEWIERSDTALYEAKQSGRNNIKIHIPPVKGWDDAAAAI